MKNQIRIIIALFFISISISAQESVLIKYEFAKGDSFNIVTERNTHKEVGFLGNPIITNNTDKFTYDFTITDIKDGDTEMEVKYGDFSHFSDSPHFVSIDFSELNGQSAKLYLNEIGDMYGFEDFDDLPELSSPTLGNINEEKYILHLKMIFPILPNKLIKEGGSWKAERNFVESDNGTIFNINVKYTYTLNSINRVNGKVQLDITNDYILTISGNGEMQGMPFIASMNGNGKKEILFNLSAGNFIKSTDEFTINGSMDFNEDDFSMPFKQKSTEVIRVE